MIELILLILAATSQTADLVAVEPSDDVKYCVYERNEEFYELEVWIDEICPGVLYTGEEYDYE
jgi:hypothetical protein